MFPVGKYWKRYTTFKNLESLYAQDGFHPSKAGSFFAALSIFKELNPNNNLEKLQYKDFTNWVKDKASFSKMIELQYQRAIDILNKNKEKLTILAELLLEKEVIFKDDLEEILGKRPFDTEAKLEAKNEEE